MNNKSDWLDRMETEARELEVRIEKLTLFLDNGGPISAKMRALMMRQLGIMHLYASVLQERFICVIDEAE